MEFASKLRWVLVVFILLFVLILVGWGLSAIARSVFGGGSSTAQLPDEDSIALASVLDDVDVVRYTVDGPVVASSEHRSYSIEISRNVAMMRVYSDYGQKVIAERSYVNNTAAYETFVQSLEAANATARYEGTDVEDDFEEEGVCPTGRRYILELGEDIRRWTTSCDRTDGTAAGKMTTMRGLFAKQIPEFDELVKDTKLNAR